MTGGFAVWRAIAAMALLDCSDFTKSVPLTSQCEWLFNLRSVFNRRTGRVFPFPSKRVAEPAN
jgi:hypothetical protein